LAIRVCLQQLLVKSVSVINIGLFVPNVNTKKLNSEVNRNSKICIYHYILKIFYNVNLNHSFKCEFRIILFLCLKTFNAITVLDSKLYYLSYKHLLFNFIISFSKIKGIHCWRNKSLNHVSGGFEQWKRSSNILIFKINKNNCFQKYLREAFTTIFTGLCLWFWTSVERLDQKAQNCVLRNVYLKFLYHSH